MKTSFLSIQSALDYLAAQGFEKLSARARRSWCTHANFAIALAADIRQDHAGIFVVYASI